MFELGLMPVVTTMGGGGGEVGEGLTKQNCKGQSGEGAIFVAALVATILNKVQDNRVTLLHSRQN